MLKNEYSLLLALIASLLLHGLPWLIDQAPPPPVKKPPPIEARLKPPPPVEPAAPPPPLILPDPPKPEPVQEKPKPEKSPPPKAVNPGPKTWTQAVAQHLKKLNERGLFYPPEAIARGLEGEALILMIIDENGQVSAARVEQSSGHRILDDAALEAVRSLRSLPADTPRDALLPVRFRLH